MLLKIMHWEVYKMNGEREVVEKIQKLLALAGEGNPEKEEAETALMKAQELLLKYNMKIEDVENVVAEEEEVQSDTILSDATAKSYMWKAKIAAVACPNFRCSVLLTGRWQPTNRKSKDLKIIGMSIDVSACLEVLRFTFAFYETSWQAFKKGVDSKCKAQTYAIKNDYLHGFLRGLDERFAENVKERALVLVRDAKVDEYLKANATPGKTLPQGHSDFNVDALAHGYVDGKSARKDAYIK